MTRKRFWGLRNALHVRLNQWGKENGFTPSGKWALAMRPVSGKPLVNFERGIELGFGTSYKECWDRLEDLRKTLGM